MKNYLLLGFLFLFTSIPFSNLQSQSRGLKYRQANTIDIVIGGEFSFRHLNNTSGDDVGLSQFNNRNELENPKGSYRFGINYIQGLTEKLSLKVGFRKTNPGIAIPHIHQIDVRKDINTISKEIIKNTDSDRRNYTYSYRFFEIPLGIRHTMVNSTCQPYLELGCSAYIYQSTKITTYSYKEAEIKRSQTMHENINKLNYVGFLAAGGNFKITKTLIGFSQIMGRYQINNLRKSELEERIMGIGAELGIRYYVGNY